MPPRGAAPQFYEALALHWKNAGETEKAIRYLVKSAEKSHDRYAIEEAHSYYRQAYEILDSKEPKSGSDLERIIDIVNAWGEVFVLRGDFNDGLAAYTLSEHLLGRICLCIAERKTSLPPLMILKNLPFMIRTIPIARRKAAFQLKRAIIICSTRKALNQQGQSSLDLVNLYHMQGRKAQARELLESTIFLFGKCNAAGFIQITRKALDRVGE